MAGNGLDDLLRLRRDFVVRGSDVIGWVLARALEF